MKRPCPAERCGMAARERVLRVAAAPGGRGGGLAGCGVRVCAHAFMRWAPLALAALTGTAACGSAAPGAGPGGAGAGGGAMAGAGGGSMDDPDPVLTTEARAALAALRYDDGAPPADPSNRVADDPAARAFGQRLFFDPSFSGRLLEGDNDGSSPTLGNRGEAGRVSCAGCHVPESGFVDTRSPH